MPSVFSRIIAGELPARFVWKDESCVAFLSIRPLRPGHALVVPRAEIDHWLDLDAELLAHLAGTAQAIGKLAGLEVPHCHFHVVPIRGVHDLDFGNQDPNPDPAVMDDAAQTIRSELHKLGYSQVSD